MVQQIYWRPFTLAVLGEESACNWAEVHKIMFWVSVEITNKMQPCNRIYYSTVHWQLNMFRAAYRSSSGALTVFVASGLHTHVVTGRSQVWVGTQSQVWVGTQSQVLVGTQSQGWVGTQSQVWVGTQSQGWVGNQSQVWVGTQSQVWVPTQTWLRTVTTRVCKPEAANTVRAPDDDRYAAQNMLSCQ